MGVQEKENVRAKAGVLSAGQAELGAGVSQEESGMGVVNRKGETGEAKR